MLYIIYPFALSLIFNYVNLLLAKIIAFLLIPLLIGKNNHNFSYIVKKSIVFFNLQQLSRLFLRSVINIAFGFCNSIL